LLLFTKVEGELRSDFRVVLVSTRQANLLIPPENVVGLVNVELGGQGLLVSLLKTLSPL
jgi:hypothetical protein